MIIDRSYILEIKENDFLYFKSCHPWYSVMAAQADIFSNQEQQSQGRFEILLSFEIRCYKNLIL